MYTDDGLAVRRRRGRKWALGSRQVPAVYDRPHQARALDFASDSLACERRIRFLMVIDVANRVNLLSIADTSISGRRVVRELLRLVDACARPGLIISDNGTEFASNAVLGWCRNRDDDNHVRPHGALGWRTPAERLSRVLGPAQNFPG
ncbi:hypothetical protein [Rhodospira trueperi]|uniref:Putative transposase n=1 Tax=Rhodospira trueperi TaxID=69960 RepID=A0A1G7AFD9_9PROT|nr:hypothetical protein [Rhodospira trueperi]SDE12735.1 putative transposase [Rhodospira trueperi]